MNNMVLNLSEAFQLAALGPTIFIIFYLLISTTKFSLTFIPLLYFIALGSNFLLPLLAIFPEFSETITLKTMTLFNENLIPALSFLLILQFLLGRLPPIAFWLVLAIPLVGGGPFLYLAITQTEVCPVNNACYQTDYLLTLYRIFGAALMFMLLMVVFDRTSMLLDKKDSQRRHKYWLIITLVVFNILIIATDLGKVAEKIAIEDVEFIKTTLAVGFVYLVLSSVFRVFSESLGIKPPTMRGRIALAKDRWLAERITWVLREEKPYLNLGYNRKSLAERLEVGEHTVSRIINEHFSKSFSELMNEYRIEDAKESLTYKDDPITAVSFDSGFSSITSFNRVFKEATGLSPSEYRSSRRVAGGNSS